MRARKKAVEKIFSRQSFFLSELMNNMCLCVYYGVGEMEREKKVQYISNIYSRSMRENGNMSSQEFNLRLVFMLPFVLLIAPTQFDPSQHL